MPIQKIPIRDMIIKDIDGSMIKDSSVCGKDIASSTIINDNINTNANIDTTKINWSTLTQEDAITNIIKQPEGIYFQNYDIEQAITYVNLPSSTTAFIQHFYISYQITVNYLTYIITSGKSSNRNCVVILDSNGTLIYESGNQSAASGTYRINVSALHLLPGIYYIGFMSSNISTRFLSQSNPNYSVIPQRGTLDFNLWGKWANPLVPSNITTSASKQPWFMISKY